MSYVSSRESLLSPQHHPVSHRHLGVGVQECHTRPPGIHKATLARTAWPYSLDILCAGSQGPFLLQCSPTVFRQAHKSPITCMQPSSLCRYDGPGMCNAQTPCRYVYKDSSSPLFVPVLLWCSCSGLVLAFNAVLLNTGGQAPVIQLPARLHAVILYGPPMHV